MDPITHKKQRGTRQLWLDAAYQLLIHGGIDAVKVMPLAKQLGQSRTSFYWFFQDLAELHRAMIDRWQDKNTGAIIRSCEKQAATMTEALFHLMDCWLDAAVFDSKLDLAIRNWARTDSDLQEQLDHADTLRMNSIAGLFARFGVSAKQAEVRAMTVYYTQVGYISMRVEEDASERLARVQDYVEFFAGSAPSREEIDAFTRRHSRDALAKSDQTHTG